MLDKTSQNESKQIMHNWLRRYKECVGEGGIKKQVFVCRGGGYKETGLYVCRGDLKKQIYVCKGEG